jgi:fatty-acyl-CoA synthase
MPRATCGWPVAAKTASSAAGELPVVYVSLRPSATVGEEQLQRFSAEHISERAAVPNVMIVVDQLPLTVVGEVFKPALRELDAHVIAQRVKALLGQYPIELTVQVTPTIQR